MCFSASSSFIASIGLLIIGLISVARVKRKNEYPLAATPLFFAAQQAAEGFVWTLLPYAPTLAAIPAYIFIGFALIFWPIYMPLALAYYEKKFWHKMLIYGCAALGTCFGLIILSLLIKNGLTVSSVHQHITYGFNTTANRIYIIMAHMIYWIAVVIPFFISSRAYVWLLGAGIAIGYWVSFIFYHMHLTSIWCFIGAILSCMVIGILAANERKKDH